MILDFIGVLLCFITVKNVLGQTYIYIAETTSGERCAIPFVYKGQVYHDCITNDANWAWCYVDKNFKKWDYCKPHPKEYEGCKIANPNITVKESEEILHEHNSFRSKVPALRMRKLEWNTELAQKAQLAAEKCQHLHVDEYLCGDRYKFGQNLFYSYADDFSPGLMTWKKVIMNWSGEEKYYNIATDSCQPGELCGHYKAVVWDWTNFIGCGKAYCHGNVNGKIRYSIQYYCNYFQGGNLKNILPYIVSTGEKCKDCHLFEKNDRFRCDKDNLCETCDTQMKGCIGIEDIKKMAEANSSLCLDTDVACAENANLCEPLKAGVDLPLPVIEYLKKCRVTCGTCP